MKRTLFCFSCLLFVSLYTLAQPAENISILLKEANNLEKQLKEEEALNKYRQVLALDSNNFQAYIKSAELSCYIAERQKDKTAQINGLTSALSLAHKAIEKDSSSAEAWYAASLTSLKLAEHVPENKTQIAYLKQAKDYADSALYINPNHARAYYVKGKWNLLILNLGWFKKASFKTLYKLQTPNIDSAIAYMETCRKLEPYFVANYYELAKAYQYKNRPEQALEILRQLVKLPTRTVNDITLKAEAKKMLEDEE